MTTSAIVVVGASLGGLHALETLTAGLPAEFAVPVVIVQHRMVEAGSMLAAILRRYSALPIEEPYDKDPILPGHIYLAPSSYHLLIDDGLFALTTEAPVSYARPSIDVLFESAADAFGSRTIGIVLTGANHDGARGAARIKARGGILIVQSPDTAECSVMPRAALAAAQADYILDIADIASVLIKICSSDEALLPK